MFNTGKKSQWRVVSLFTGAIFLFVEICFPVQSLSQNITMTKGVGSEVATAAFALDLPPEMGKIESLYSGNGPSLVHIQTAHGNYEAQKKIESILHHLKDEYGFKHVFLEGTAFKLESNLLNLFPNFQDATREILDRLTKKAYVKGPELFLKDVPDAEGYGIENVQTYRENGEAFKKVLTQQEITNKFLQDIDIQIERLTAPYLSGELKSFIKLYEKFEKNLYPFMDWLNFLKKRSRENLEIDLEDAAWQIEWPMLVRIFTIDRMNDELDRSRFNQEKKDFIKAIKRFMAKTSEVELIEKLLKNPTTSHRLSDPETYLLFETMIRQLPENFDYGQFPQTKQVIGRLILQSEIKPMELMNEMNRLTSENFNVLATSRDQKQVVELLKDYWLLNKLFKLELTPGEYDEILRKNREDENQRLNPEVMIKRFLELNRDGRVKDIEFKNIEAITKLYQASLKFYKLVKERDGLMIKNLEKKMAELGTEKAVVITGGFHATPFEEYFKKKDFNYALVMPKISTVDGKEAYVKSVLQTSTYESIPSGSHSEPVIAQLGVSPERSRAAVIVESSRVLLASETRTMKEFNTALATSKMLGRYRMQLVKNPRNGRDYFGIRKSETRIALIPTTTRTEILTQSLTVPGDLSRARFSPSSSIATDAQPPDLKADQKQLEPGTQSETRELNVAIRGEDDSVLQVPIELPEGVEADLKSHLSEPANPQEAKDLIARLVERLSQKGLKNSDYFAKDHQYLFWLLDHLSDQELGLSIKEQKELGVRVVSYLSDMMVEWGEQYNHLKVTRKNPEAFEAWWYVLVRLSSLKDRINQRAAENNVTEHIYRIEGAIVNIISRINHFIELSIIDFNVWDSWEPRIFEFSGKYSNLSNFLTSLLTPRGRKSIIDPVAARSSEALYKSFEKPDDSFEEQERIAQAHRELLGAIRPDTLDKEKVWKTPVPLIAAAAKENAKRVIIHPEMWSATDKMHHLVSGALGSLFQVDLLKNLGEGRGGIKTWIVLGDPSFRFKALARWLFKARGDTRTPSELRGEVRDYFNLSRQNNPGLIENYLDFPKTDQTDALQNISFLNGLWNAKESANATVLFFENQTQFAEWLGENQEKRFAVLGIPNVNEAPLFYQLDRREVFSISHIMSQPYFIPDSQDSRSLGWAIHQLTHGEGYEWGGGEEEDVITLALKSHPGLPANQQLRDLYGYGDSKGSWSAPYLTGWIDNRDSYRDKHPGDAHLTDFIVFSKHPPLGGDGDEGREVDAPKPDPANFLPVGPSSPVTVSSETRTNREDKVDAKVAEFTRLMELSESGRVEIRDIDEMDDVIKKLQVIHNDLQFFQNFRLPVRQVGDKKSVLFPYITVDGEEKSSKWGWVPFTELGQSETVQVFPLEAKGEGLNQNVLEQYGFLSEEGILVARSFVEEDPDEPLSYLRVHEESTMNQALNYGIRKNYFLSYNPSLNAIELGTEIVETPLLEEDQVILNKVANFIKKDPVDSDGSGQGRAEQIFDELRQANIPRRFLPLFHDYRMVNYYRSFIDFYQNLAQEQGASQTSQMGLVELKEKFVDSLGKATVYQAVSYPRSELAAQRRNPSSESFSSPFRLTSDGGDEEESRLFHLYGLNTIIQSRWEGKKLKPFHADMDKEYRREKQGISILYNEAKLDFPFIPVSTASQDLIQKQGRRLAEKAAQTAIRQTAAADARLKVYFNRYSEHLGNIYGSHFDENSLYEGAFSDFVNNRIREYDRLFPPRKVFSQFRKMIVEVREIEINRFDLIRQAGGQLVSEAVPIEGSREPKPFPVRLARFSSIEIDAANDPDFEVLLTHVPPEAIRSRRFYSSGQGIGYGLHGNQSKQTAALKELNQFSSMLPQAASALNPWMMTIKQGKSSEPTESAEVDQSSFYEGVGLDQIAQIFSATIARSPELQSSRKYGPDSVDPNEFKELRQKAIQTIHQVFGISLIDATFVVSLLSFNYTGTTMSNYEGRHVLVYDPSRSETRMGEGNDAELIFNALNRGGLSSDKIESFLRKKKNQLDRGQTYEYLDLFEFLIDDPKGTLGKRILQFKVSVQHLNEVGLTYRLNFESLDDSDKDFNFSLEVGKEGVLSQSFPETLIQSLALEYSYHENVARTLSSFVLQKNDSLVNLDSSNLFRIAVKLDLHRTEIQTYLGKGQAGMDGFSNYLRSILAQELARSEDEIVAWGLALVHAYKTLIRYQLLDAALDKEGIYQESLRRLIKTVLSPENKYQGSQNPILPLFWTAAGLEKAPRTFTEEVRVRAMVEHAFRTRPWKSKLFKIILDGRENVAFLHPVKIWVLFKRLLSFLFSPLSNLFKFIIQNFQDFGTIGLILSVPLLMAFLSFFDSEQQWVASEGRDMVIALEKAYEQEDLDQIKLLLFESQNRRDLLNPNEYRYDNKLIIEEFAMATGQIMKNDLSSEFSRIGGFRFSTWKLRIQEAEEEAIQTGQEQDLDFLLKALIEEIEKEKEFYAQNQKRIKKFIVLNNKGLFGSSGTGYYAQETEKILEDFKTEIYEEENFVQETYGRMRERQSQASQRRSETRMLALERLGKDTDTVQLAQYMMTENALDEWGEGEGFVKDTPIFAYSITSSDPNDLPEEIRIQLDKAFTGDDRALEDFVGSFIILQFEDDNVTLDFYPVGMNTAKNSYDFANLNEVQEKNEEYAGNIQPFLDGLAVDHMKNIKAVSKTRPVVMHKMSKIGYARKRVELVVNWGNGLETQVKEADEDAYLIRSDRQWYMVKMDKDGLPIGYKPTVNQNALRKASAESEYERQLYVTEVPMVGYRIETENPYDLPEIIRKSLVANLGERADALKNFVGGVIHLDVVPDEKGNFKVLEAYPIVENYFEATHEEVSSEKLEELNPVYLDRLNNVMGELLDFNDKNFVPILNTQPIEMAKLSDLGFDPEEEIRIEMKWGDKAVTQAVPAGEDAYLASDGEQYYVVPMDEQGLPRNYGRALSQGNLARLIADPKTETPIEFYIKDAPTYAYKITEDNYNKIPAVILKDVGKEDQTSYQGGNGLNKHIGSVINLQPNGDFYVIGKDVYDKQYDKGLDPALVGEKNKKYETGLRKRLGDLLDQDPNITVILKTVPVLMVRIKYIGLKEGQRIAVNWGYGPTSQRARGSEAFLTYAPEYEGELGEGQWYMINVENPSDPQSNPAGYVPAPVQTSETRMLADFLQQLTQREDAVLKSVPSTSSETRIMGSDQIAKDIAEIKKATPKIPEIDALMDRLMGQGKQPAYGSLEEIITALFELKRQLLNLEPFFPNDGLSSLTKKVKKSIEYLEYFYRTDFSEPNESNSLESLILKEFEGVAERIAYDDESSWNDFLAGYERRRINDRLLIAHIATKVLSNRTIFVGPKVILQRLGQVLNPKAAGFLSELIRFQGGKIKIDSERGQRALTYAFLRRYYRVNDGEELPERSVLNQFNSVTVLAADSVLNPEDAENISRIESLQKSFLETFSTRTDVSRRWLLRQMRASLNHWQTRSRAFERKAIDETSQQTAEAAKQRVKAAEALYKEALKQASPKTMSGILGERAGDVLEITLAWKSLVKIGNPYRKQGQILLAEILTIADRLIPEDDPAAFQKFEEDIYKLGQNEEFLTEVELSSTRQLYSGILYALFFARLNQLASPDDLSANARRVLKHFEWLLTSEAEATVRQNRDFFFRVERVHRFYLMAAFYNNEFRQGYQDNFDLSDVDLPLTDYVANTVLSGRFGIRKLRDTPEKKTMFRRQLFDSIFGGKESGVSIVSALIASEHVETGRHLIQNAWILLDVGEREMLSDILVDRWLRTYWYELVAKFLKRPEVRKIQLISQEIMNLRRDQQIQIDVKPLFQFFEQNRQVIEEKVGVKKRKDTYLVFLDIFQSPKTIEKIKQLFEDKLYTIITSGEVQKVSWAFNTAILEGLQESVNDYLAQSETRTTAERRDISEGVEFPRSSIRSETRNVGDALEEAFRNLTDRREWQRNTSGFQGAFSELANFVLNDTFEGLQFRFGRDPTPEEIVENIESYAKARVDIFLKFSDQTKEPIKKSGGAMFTHHNKGSLGSILKGLGVIEDLLQEDYNEEAVGNYVVKMLKFHFVGNDEKEGFYSKMIKSGEYKNLLDLWSQGRVRPDSVPRALYTREQENGQDKEQTFFEWLHDDRRVEFDAKEAAEKVKEIVGFDLKAVVDDHPLQSLPYFYRAQLIKVQVNPENRDISALYTDSKYNTNISNLLLETNATRAVMTSVNLTTPEQMQWALDNWNNLPQEDYIELKRDNHYARYVSLFGSQDETKDGQDFTYKIVRELQGLGLSRDDVKLVDREGRIALEIRWAYPGTQEKKRRTIEFYNMNVLNEEDQAAFVQQLQGQLFDVYYEQPGRVSLDGSSFVYRRQEYSAWIARVAALLSDGGFILTDEYMSTSDSLVGEFNNHATTATTLLAESFENRLRTPQASWWGKLIPNPYFFGDATNSILLQKVSSQPIEAVVVEDDPLSKLPDREKPVSYQGNDVVGFESIPHSDYFLAYVSRLGKYGARYLKRYFADIVNHPETTLGDDVDLGTLVSSAFEELQKRARDENAKADRLKSDNSWSDFQVQWELMSDLTQDSATQAILSYLAYGEVLPWEGSEDSFVERFQKDLSLKRLMEENTIPREGEVFNQYQKAKRAVGILLEAGQVFDLITDIVNDIKTGNQSRQEVSTFEDFVLAVEELLNEIHESYSDVGPLEKDAVTGEYVVGDERQSIVNVFLLNDPEGMRQLAERTLNMAFGYKPYQETETTTSETRTTVELEKLEVDYKAVGVELPRFAGTMAREFTQGILPLFWALQLGSAALAAALQAQMGIEVQSMQNLGQANKQTLARARQVIQRLADQGKVSQEEFEGLMLLAELVDLNATTKRLVPVSILGFPTVQDLTSVIAAAVVDSHLKFHFFFEEDDRDNFEERFVSFREEVLGVAFDEYGVVPKNLIFEIAPKDIRVKIESMYRKNIAMGVVVDEREVVEKMGVRNQLVRVHVSETRTSIGKIAFATSQMLLGKLNFAEHFSKIFNGQEMLQIWDTLLSKLKTLVAVLRSA